MAKRRNELFWQGEDPRGRHVSLNQEALEKHIEPGHPEVASNRSLIPKTITDPDRIVASGPKFPNREVFERLDDVKGYGSPRRYYWVVVVEWRRPKRPSFRGRAEPSLLGAIFTAYASGTKRKGDETWTRPDSP